MSRNRPPDGRRRTPARCARIVIAALLPLGALCAAPDASANVTGVKRVMVLRVHFKDYTATTHYSKAQITGFFDTDLNKLWNETSYGQISLSNQVTDVYALPKNRSDYVDDAATGDLSGGAKFNAVLDDAIASVPTTIDSGLDWSNLDAIVVVMSETDATQFHRGQGTHDCDLRQGPGGAKKHLSLIHI